MKPRRRRSRYGIVLGVLVAAAALAAAADGPRPPAPFLLILGTAQDGGIPHLGGRAAADEAARRDPALRRLVASLLVVDPASGGRWLIDASPDLAEQIDRAEAALGARPGTTSRPPPVDGVFLTHAHVGHYLGLAQFGREIASTRELPVYGSQRMAEFLSHNGPWEQLVRLRQIALAVLEPNRTVELAPGLSITPFLVPHRDEYTDTLGFEIRGPHRGVLYIPDIDKWERWSERIEERIADVDVALLDASFFDANELPGRAMSEVPHPLVVESIARFSKLPESERRKVVFTHLNHSNPAALAGTAERQAIEAAAMRVASEGERIDL